MSLIFMDGCDHYGVTADIDKKWDSIASAVTYNATAGRFGGGCIVIGLDDLPLIKGVGDTSEIHLGFYFRKDTGTFGADHLIRIRNGGSLLCQVDTLVLSGLVTLFTNGGVVATSSVALPEDTWVYLEIRYKSDSSTGEFEIKMDGNILATFSGNTDSSSRVVQSIEFYSPASTDDSYFDDFIFMDTSGSVNNGYIGERRIETVYPTADTAQADFTPLSAGDNFVEVDEGDAGPDGDTTYNQSSTVGHKDLFSVGNLTTINIESISAVQAIHSARKDDAGVRTTRNVIKTGTTEGAGTEIGLSTAYTFYSDIYETDPDTATTWTESGVNGMQAGYEVVT